MPKESDLAKKLARLIPNRKAIRAVVLRLKFPEDARNDQQVEIVEVVDTQWVPGLGGRK